jgi:hypothetical protein
MGVFFYRMEMANRPENIQVVNFTLVHFFRMYSPVGKTV